MITDIPVEEARALQRLVRALAREHFLLSNDAEGTFEDRVEAAKEKASAMVELRRYDSDFVYEVSLILNPRLRGA